MDPVISYLTIETLSSDPTEARKIRIKAPQYSLQHNMHYKKGYMTPCLKGDRTDYQVPKVVFCPQWVSNPVMVKNPEGIWRMCIDFTNLNMDGKKSFPKDSYMLPKIDQQIESLEGFKLKCFLDAYKGYHQIYITKEDEEKTSFHTEQGIFCYAKCCSG